MSAVENTDPDRVNNNIDKIVPAPQATLDTEFVLREIKGEITYVSRSMQKRSFDVPADWRLLSGADLIEKLELTPSLDAGFPFLSPIAKNVINSIERRIRELALTNEYTEIEMPTVANIRIIEKSKVADSFRSEIISLGSEHSNLILSPTTEEPLIAMLEVAGMSSYRHVPLRIFHFNDVFRWIQRTKGFYSTREIHTCIFAHITANHEQYLESMNAFSKLCSSLWKEMGIKVTELCSNDGSAVEHFYSAPNADRFVHDSVVFSKAWFPQPPDATRENKQLVSLCMAYPFQKVTQFNLRLLGADGKTIVPHFGTCGIGIQRAFIALFDEHRDEYGINFPKWLRPWDFTVVPLGAEAHESSQRVAQILSSLGQKVVVDDREKKTMGERLSTADFYGIPFRCVIGRKEIETGTVNIRSRRGSQLDLNEHVTFENFASRVLELLDRNGSNTYVN